MKRLITIFLLLGVMLPAVKAQMSDCLDFTNLYSSNVTCTYGENGQPFQSTGVMSGRHTVMTSGTDPYSGLSCVAPGETASIKLGNSSVGYQAEAITYTYVVDTNQYDILMLKYSAVLEDPGHGYSEQPRFTFQLLNNYNMEIDPICGSADFVSGNTTDGWHGSSVLWKDWTTVGFDVSAYHGQTIKIQLATYDCSAWGHFGYAYFAIGCAKKQIKVKACGHVDDVSYTAPDGFDYRWYWANDPGTTVSTNQSVTVSADSSNILYCDAMFTENASCRFTLSTVVQTRFPIADFTAKLAKCFSAISFENTSSISRDGINYDSLGGPCTYAEWRFQTAGTSEEYEPGVVDFPNGPGTYDVTLISSIEGLNGNNCYDTITKQITIPPYTPMMWGDTLICKENSGTFNVTNGGDSLAVFQWSYNNLTTPTITVPDSGSYYVIVSDTANACLDTFHIHLAYFPDFIVDLGPDTTVCDNEGFVLNAYDATRPGATYLWNNSETGATTEVWLEGPYIVTVTNENGCSISDTINMSFYPRFNPYLGEDTTLCDLATLVLDAYTTPHTDTIMYHWQDNSTNRTYTVQPNGGVYWVVVNDICYAASDTINVDYLQMPSVDLGPDTQLCKGNPIVLNATTPNYTYYWDYDGSTNNYFFPTETGTYTVTISGYCGSATASINVDFHDCNIIVPNVYTPNGDGVNDCFEIDFYDDFEFYIYTFSVHIYDRWGKLVYHSLDPEFKWDGTEATGSSATDGVYYWVITFSTEGGIYQEKHGSVTRISSK